MIPGEALMMLARKDHFLFAFHGPDLDMSMGNEYYCFLDGFSEYFQIPIDPQDQEKTTFTSLMERLPIDVFLLTYVMLRACSKDKMLKWCEGTNLVLYWEKCHFMVKEGIVLGHRISKFGIEVDRAKVDVIAKLPHPTSVKGGECSKSKFVTTQSELVTSGLNKRRVAQRGELLLMQQVAYQAF
ncbi:hypothetical protein Tco_1101534 [Tanacetum coccineum]